VTRGLAELPRRWRCTALPAGTVARVDIGSARDFLDPFGELAGLVRDCTEVEVIGTDPAGVTAVQAALTSRWTGTAGYPMENE
jgi:hypothetical protein